MARHSVLEVSQGALRFNLDLIKTFLFENQKIIAIVKANAYGIGSVQVARLLKEQGIDFFAVACIGEAIELRENGIQDTLLVLSPFLENEIDLYIKYHIIPTIVDLERASLLSKKAEIQKKIIPIHIKIDTGMGRLGIAVNEAEKEIKKIAKLSGLKIDGLFSHFPSADLLDDFTQDQINQFKQLIVNLEKENIMIQFKHISNSSGLISFNDPFFNAVRPGIVLYGAYPSKIMKDLIFPQTVITWKSNLIQIKKIQKDATISYGRTFKASKNMKVGVVPVGYADGFSTLNSSKGFVYIHDTSCAILGRICMDYFMVDLSNIEAEIGDEVIIYGDFDGIRPDDLAERTGLISYEILTNISMKTNRIYLDS